MNEDCDLGESIIPLRTTNQDIIETLVNLSKNSYPEMVSLIDFCIGRETKLNEGTRQVLSKNGLLDGYGNLPLITRNIISDFYYGYLEWNEHLWNRYHKQQNLTAENKSQ